MGKVLEQGGATEMAKKMNEKYEPPWQMGGAGNQLMRMDKTIEGVLVQGWDTSYTDEMEWGDAGVPTKDKWFRSGYHVFPWANDGEGFMPEEYAEQIGDGWKPSYDWSKLQQEKILEGARFTPQSVLDANIAPAQGGPQVSELEEYDPTKKPVWTPT